MENQRDPNPNNPPKKRPRIPFMNKISVKPTDLDEINNLPETDDEADVTDEDLILLGDPDQDQDGGVDELLGDAQFLDDTDFDGDPLNEESGRRAGSGRDLDVPNEELENAGDALLSEDEENDYFGFTDDEAPEGDDTKDLF